MVLLFRMAVTLLTARFRPRLGPLDESVLRFRVMPNDIDINRHMNNGRYLTMMDLGRGDLISRNGILGVILKQHWYPLVGSASVRFLRSLDPFQVYELRTRLLCWDEKWFYIEHRFQRGQDLVAVAWIQGLFRGKNGNVTPREVLERTGVQIESPPIPAAITGWQSAMRANEPGPKNTSLAAE